MVAIKSYKNRIFAALLSLICVGSAVAQESDYTSLRRQSAELVAQDDSLSHLVTLRRRELSEGGDDAPQISSQIVLLEQQIFDLRLKKQQLTAQISELEASGAVGNIEPQTAKVSGSEGVKSLSASKFIGSKIPAADFENLRRAEQREGYCEELFTKYKTSYHRLRELKQLYDQAEVEDDAIKYSDEFESLTQQADSLSTLLADSWSKLYDNKSFAYSMVLEVIGDGALLDRESEITRNAAAQISTIESSVVSEPALRYEYQKRGQIALEQLIAGRLKLSNCLDSLNTAAAKLEKREKLTDLSEVVFTKRTFIMYDPVKFSTSTPYTKSKPIPDAAQYKRGVIYRIQLGAYNTQQLPTIFRGAYPLSRDRALGFWTYYAGGFATLEEAEAAAELCRRKGFKRPEIVRWLDGVRRNLYREPLPKDNGYRVVISGVTELSEPLKEAINKSRGGAELSKIAADKFVIGTISEKEIADKLIKAIQEVNPEIESSILELK